MSAPDVRPRVVPLDAAGPTALRDLTPTLYAALRARARQERRRGPARDTLDTTAVVHEAFLRLSAQRCQAWGEREGLIAAAGAMMRRAIVDHWRRRHAARRGGRAEMITLEADTPEPDRPDPLADELGPALARLAAYDARLARVVAARYLAGLAEEEIAELLGVTVRTVRRDWVKARGWLRATLAPDA